MKKTLVFDYEISGHHLEYLNHIYCGAGTKTEEFFVFALHPSFNDVKNLFKWPDFPNVVIIFPAEDEINIRETSSLVASLKLSMFLRKIIRKEKITDVFLISLIVFLPFLPFFINSKTGVSGIIYSIYTRNKSKTSLMRKIQDHFKYLILARSSCFKKIFLLNDPASCRLLNRKWQTKKFSCLPDPVMMIPSDNLEDIRKVYNIGTNKKIFLHFGGLSARKGTVLLLKAITLIGKEQLNDMCFIFAGIVNEDIRQEFYSLISYLSGKVQIMVFDSFCSYTFIGSLCASSSYIVLPYSNVSRSSGVLGYAAQFGVPVIGPSHGLIGNLISRYKLGYRYKIEKPAYLSSILQKHACMQKEMIYGSSYMTANSVAMFQKVILG